MSSDDARPVVAVAGARGFIGQALAPLLGEAFERRGLAALGREPGFGGYDRWEACDLFSLRDAEEALRGARRAVYLVRAHRPSSRLTQARIIDLDLVCADNFARAARSNGVERIIYLGGRREVEETLGAHGVPLVALRAGPVIGAGGAAWLALSRLVRHLPVIACPSWTRTVTRPIAVADAAALLAACLTSDAVPPGAYEVGGPEAVSCRDLVLRTARALGLHRRIVALPFDALAASRLALGAVTGLPQAIIAPLFEDLVRPSGGDRALQARPAWARARSTRRWPTRSRPSARHRPRPIRARPAPRRGAGRDRQRARGACARCSG
ncbi:MAG: NAD-dependent epimerase/dehydratase family protein [Myxococcota bacterium]